MLSKTLQDAINEQIKNELYSAYLYLSMSMYFEADDLPGFAHWMRCQFLEEQGHALKLMDYINDRDGRVTLQAIPQPPTDFASAVDVFEKTLEHERGVTASINKIYALALKEGDYNTANMLHWFIGEQVEEEATADLMLERVKAAAGNRGILVMFDGHYTSREATLKA